MRKSILFLFAALMAAAPMNADAKTKKKVAKKSQVVAQNLTTLELIEKVNGKWQTDNKAEADASPMTAKYQAANMRVYNLTQKAQYLEYADKWARHNKFTCAKDADRSLARQCFMVYRQLNAVAPAAHKLQLRNRINGGSCMKECDGAKAQCGMRSEECGANSAQCNDCAATKHSTLNTEPSKTWEEMKALVNADGTVMTEGCKTCATVAFLNAACDQLLKEAAMDTKASFEVTVHNGEKMQRTEVVELCGKTVAEKLGIPCGVRLFKVLNAVGKEVPCQLTYDGKVLVEASVRPCGDARFTVVKGMPQTFPAAAYGRMYPERVDDIAWENDRGSYRCYGPALQRSGEQAFGNDVWLKNTPDLVNENRYYIEDVNKPVIAELKKTNPEKAEAVEKRTSYHYDQGYGLDCYKVGPTLGCGTPALMDGDKVVFPYCYSEYELLDNGPLRFTVRLKYNPSSYKGDNNVVENRILSLDKGSNFNKMTVWYDGLTQPADVASGFVIHTEDTESVVVGKDYVHYADPTDNPQGQNFQIFVAAIFPQDGVQTRKVMYPEAVKGASGHALGIKKGYKSGERFTYYFGSAWSKYDCRTQNEWQARIENFMASKAVPMTVKY
ncbi:MAG: DUF4861 domain-containing protein [Prevotella sp.]|nr:DUF4861 domain-containing protein [Prevotella sp.]